MAVTEIDMMELDVLPPNCSIEALAGFTPEGGLLLCFRAVRERRWFRRRRVSDWSGWFAYEGEPIVLRWATFWEP